MSGHTMSKVTSFGLRLKALRRQRGLSQAALAGDEISTGYLSRLESGARQPTERVITYLAKQLDVDRSAFEAPPTSGTLTQALSIAASTDNDEAVEHLVEVLENARDEEALLRWQALWLIAQYRRRRGERLEERAALEELTRIADQLELPTLQCRSRTELARCLRTVGEVTRSLELAKDAHRVAKDAGLAEFDRGNALLTLVSVEAEAGRLPDARAHVDELVELVTDRSDVLRAEAMWAAGTVRFRQGDHEAAQELLSEAMKHLDSRTDPLLWARLRLAAASQYLQTQPPSAERARACLAEAEAPLEIIGTPVQQQEFLALQAHLAFAEGRLADARDAHDRLDFDALRLTYRDRIRLQTLDGLLLISEGRRSDGTALLKELAEDAHRASNLDLAAEIWRILAETLAKAGAES
jgi:transcriptional regulator with XRE-family HTH domain